MDRNLGSGRAAMERTPTFFTSPEITVTGLKVTSGNKALPIAAIASVEVLPPPQQEVSELLRIGLVAPFLFFFGRVLGDAFGAGTSIFVVLIGVVTLLMGVLGIVTAVMRRDLHVFPVSGNKVTVKCWDVKRAHEMKAAIERAMDYRESAAVRGPSVADELGKLAALRDAGVLTEADWSQAKELFLGKRPDAQELAIEQLRQLHSLMLSKVLSESEYNSKKWEILSRDLRA